MSDSEMDSEVMQKPVSKKQTRRQKTTSDTEDGKRIFSLPSKSTPKKRKSTSADIFGLSRSVKNDTEKVVSSFSSFFVNKVANGNERRTAVLDGEYVVDLKVYRTSDIVASDSADAWRKALVRIKLQTEEDSDHWKALQRFVLTADKLFEQDPHFYSDRICAK